MKYWPFPRATTLVLTSVLWAAAHAAGDPTRGADIFRQNCTPCHSQERGQNLVGPSLFAVIDRPAASVGEFSYSDAMKRSGIVSTVDHLMAYLRAPRRFIPGVKMMFAGLPDEKDRENVLAYLATLGTAPGGANANAAASQASKEPEAAK